MRERLPACLQYTYARILSIGRRIGEVLTFTSLTLELYIKYYLVIGRGILSAFKSISMENESLKIALPRTTKTLINLKAQRPIRRPHRTYGTVDGRPERAQHLL